MGCVGRLLACQPVNHSAVPGHHRRNVSTSHAVLGEIDTYTHWHRKLRRRSHKCFTR